MGIVYIVSIAIFLIFFLLWKKTNKTLNLLTWIVLGLVTVFSLNMFFVFVLYFIRLKSNFIVLSIIYFSLSAILYYFKICAKKLHGKKVFQQYEYDLKNIIYVALLIIIIVFVGIYRFKNFSSIMYDTVDPAVHHTIARHYSQVETLLDKHNSIDEIYHHFDRNMTGSYVNGGIFMNIFHSLPSYVSFILFNMYTLLLSALVFFCIGVELNKRKHNILIFFLTCLYILGYPLCEFLFGFYYLGIGVLMVSAIILVMILISGKYIIINNKILIMLLSLINYSLYFSYYLFVPFVYLSEGVFILIMLIGKKLKLKMALMYGLFTLIIPFIIGTCYFLLPGFINPVESNVNGLVNEGAIYRNLISNYYIFIPLTIYYLFVTFKNKKIGYHLVLLIVMLLGISGLLIIGLKGHLSSYYYYKFYYILWLVCFVIVVDLVHFLTRDSLKMLYSWIILIIILVGMTVFKIENKIQTKNNLFNGNNTSSYLVDVYNYNYTSLTLKNSILSKKEMDIVDKAKYYKRDCKSSNLEFPVIGNYNQKFWFYTITNMVPTYNHEKNVGTLYSDKFNYAKWKKDTHSKCIIIFNTSNNDITNKIENSDSKIYKVLYKNESGVIIKKR